VPFTQQACGEGHVEQGIEVRQSSTSLTINHVNPLVICAKHLVEKDVGVGADSEDGGRSGNGSTGRISIHQRMACSIKPASRIIISQRLVGYGVNLYSFTTLEVSG
jgi:hypothetical protein